MSDFVTVPPEVCEIVPAAAWKPLMWFYCEGIPMGFIFMTSFPGAVIIRTQASIAAAVMLFVGGMVFLQKLAIWDSRAFRVFRRSRRYVNTGTGLIPARAMVGAREVRFRRRVH